MKLNIALAVGVVAWAGLVGQALAQLSAPANATAKAIVENASANGRVLFVAGASSAQNGFGEIARALFTGSSYYFVPDPDHGRTANDYRAYAGKLYQSAGGWAPGTNVIIIHRARGGSVMGVNPLARRTMIESLNVSTTSCTKGSGTSQSPFECGLDSRVPDAGISAVDPRVFDGLFNTEGEPAEPALDPIETASLTNTPIFGMAFGVAMTRNLPLFKINKSAMSAIMTANIGAWSEVDASLPADDILVCRQVNGSGTQAVANLYFGNYPCSTGVRANVPADRTSGSAWNGSGFVVEGNTGFLNVVENSSSGDVRTCLNTASDAALKPFNAAADATTDVGYTSYTTANRAGMPINVKFRNGRPHKAVAVLSLDSLSYSSSTSKWAFRSLAGAGEITWNGAIGSAPLTTGTGIFPTLADLVDATWDMQGWTYVNLPYATTGNKKALIDDFITLAKSPAIQQGLTNLRWVTAGISGVADNSPLGGQVLRAGYLGGDQCAPLNRNY